MKKIKENISAIFKSMTLKSYLKRINDFFNINLKKTFMVMCVAAILLIVIGVQTEVNSIQKETNTNYNLDGVTFGESYISNIQVIFMVIFAGIVPYMYIPVAGGLIGMYDELVMLAYIIVEKGYLKAILLYVFPLLLNICIISVATALGVYICKTVTGKYKIDNIKHMNSTNFRLKWYEVIKNDKKKKELEEKKNKKLMNLEKKYKKIDYFGLVNITIILFILQIIASLLRIVVI